MIQNALLVKRHNTLIDEIEKDATEIEYHSKLGNSAWADVLRQRVKSKLTEVESIRRELGNPT